MTTLWRGLDYNVYVLYNQEGKMTPQKQPMYYNKKLLFFAKSFRSAATYSLGNLRPTVLEFKDLDFDFYEIKQMDVIPFYYYTERTISINRVNIIYTLKKTPEVKKMLDSFRQKYKLTSVKNRSKYWDKKVLQ